MPSPEELKRIRVENFTGLGGAQEYIHANAPPQLLELLLASEYAVFAYAESFDPIPVTGNNYCLALVGLTRPEPPDKNPRIPVNKSFGFVKLDRRGKLDADATTNCKASAVRSAFRNFFGTPLADLLDHDQKIDPGGKRPKRPPNGAMVSYYAATSSGFSPEGYLALPVPGTFRQAFDYRRLQVIGISTNTVFDPHLVCFGLVGFAARSPDDRNPRWPGRVFASAREVSNRDTDGPGSRDRCEGEMLERALNDQLASSWDDQGLLRNFAATIEEGLAPVAPVKARAAAPRKEHRPPGTPPPPTPPSVRRSEVRL